MTKREMLQRICDIWLERGEGVDSEMFIRQQMKHTRCTIAACLAKIEKRKAGVTKSSEGKR